MSAPDADETIDAETVESLIPVPQAEADVASPGEPPLAESVPVPAPPPDDAAADGTFSPPEPPPAVARTPWQTVETQRRAPVILPGERLRRLAAVLGDPPTDVAPPPHRPLIRRWPCPRSTPRRRRPQTSPDQRP